MVKIRRTGYNDNTINYFHFMIVDSVSNIVIQFIRNNTRNNARNNKRNNPRR